MKVHSVTQEKGYCENLRFPDKVLTSLGNSNITTTRCQANIEFYSMQYSLIVDVIVVGVGAFMFYLTALWIIKDKMRAEHPENGDETNAQPSETKQMLGIVEAGRNDQPYIEDNDLPPTMLIIEKEDVQSRQLHPLPSGISMYYEIESQPYNQILSAVNSMEAMNKNTQLGKHRANPGETTSMKEGKGVQMQDARSKQGYKKLPATMATLQRLLDSPDTSTERLDNGLVDTSTASSTAPTPPTPPKIARA